MVRKRTLAWFSSFQELPVPTIPSNLKEASPPEKKLAGCKSVRSRAIYSKQSACHLNGFVRTMATYGYEPKARIIP
jgi:hypothetical protein